MPHWSGERTCNLPRDDQGFGRRSRQPRVDQKPQGRVLSDKVTRIPSWNVNTAIFRSIRSNTACRRSFTHPRSAAFLIKVSVRRTYASSTCSAAMSTQCDAHRRNVGLLHGFTGSRCSAPTLPATSTISQSTGTSTAIAPAVIHVSTARRVLDRGQPAGCLAGSPVTRT